MMEAITDIEVAATLMKEGKSGGSLNQVDIKYRKLKAKLEPLEKHTQEYSFIEQYVTNSHAQVHNISRLKLIMFSNSREKEKQNDSSNTLYCQTIAYYGMVLVSPTTLVLLPKA